MAEIAVLFGGIYVYLRGTKPVTAGGRRVMTLEEMANVAVFMASDKASGMTGTIINLSMDSLDGWRLSDRRLC